MKKSFKTYAIILVILLSIPLMGNVSEEKYKDLQIFAKVLNYIQKYYVEEVDTKKLIYGGIKGMLSELDPHTNFLPPDIFKEFQEETSGEFGGLGVEISLQNKVLTVISPIEDTPAWKAGIKAGDKIVSINGVSTKDQSLVESAQNMKGKKGQVIKLGIMRKNFEKPKVFSIKRGTVKIKSVKMTDLGKGYFYFKVTSFIEKTTKDFKKFVKKINKKQKIKGMIIDLRNNPGGLLDQAVQISDLFLSKGTIVSTMGRNEKEKEIIYAKAKDDLLDFPIIIIVNEFSASASEILAGALQDNDRAVVLGHKTFGKGSVQSVVKLGDGSGLKLTVARYYTPKGREIQAEGIEPDIIVDEVDPEAFEKAKIKRRVRREKDIHKHLKNKKSLEVVTSVTAKIKILKEDFQILQAYNYLKAWAYFQKK